MEAGVNWERNNLWVCPNYGESGEMQALIDGRG